MRKVILYILFSIFFLTYFVWSANAQVQCSDWHCGIPYPCTGGDPPVDGMCVDCECADGGFCDGQTCGPGQYCCNQADQCCPTDPGTPPPGDTACWNGAVNCPMGWTVSLNQPINRFCSINVFGDNMCHPRIGSAQRETGCCNWRDDPDNPGEQYCPRNLQITTYACCPPGATEVCTPVSETYTKYLNWPGSTYPIDKCWRFDEFGDFKLGTYVTHYELNCGPRPGRDEETGERNYGCDAIVTCSETTQSCSCSPVAVTPTPTLVPSCTITLSGPYAPPAGGTITVSPVTTVVGGSILRVVFNVGNPAVATVCASGTGPCPAGSGSYTDSATAFNTDLTGIGGGSTTLTAVATTTLGATCTSNAAAVNVANTIAWWQVIGGDIIAGNASGGSVQSLIPGTCTLPVCSPFLIKNNPAGFSGVAQSATSGSGAINTGTGTVSLANWRATGAGFLGLEGYNYTYFKRKIPSNTTPTVIGSSTVTNATLQNCTPDTTGYCWFTYSGGSALSISGGAVALGSKKVILFVEGADFNLNQKVTVTRGLGAFYVFAERNITIAPTVGDAAVAAPTPDIEGILFAGDQVIIPTNGTSNDLQLHIRGAVVGLGNGGTNDGIDPNRTLSINGLYPAEVFEFGPDLIMNWPSWLTRRTLQWREVAP